MLHQIALFLHLAAMMIAMGSSIGSMLAEKQLWNRVHSRSEDAKALLPILATAPKLIMAGIVLFLLSGLTMLYSVNWVFLTQPWFIAKFALFLTLPVRGALIGAPTLVRISNIVKEDPGNWQSLRPLESKMLRFHIIQFTIVAIIIILVLFKFG